MHPYKILPIWVIEQKEIDILGDINGKGLAGLAEQWEFVVPLSYFKLLLNGQN